MHNGDRTTCPQGHPYDLKYRDGFRRCSQCRAEIAKAYYAANPDHLSSRLAKSAERRREKRARTAATTAGRTPRRKRNTLGSVLRRCVVNADGCWIWTGARTADGYGMSNWEGRTALVHRLIYSLLVGPIPPGLQLDHLCRNPPCCNPTHLEPVTPAENTRRAQPFRRARQKLPAADAGP